MKTVEDFDNLITAVWGRTTPNARKYWMNRMRNENRSWSWVGGTNSWYKREGYSLDDFGTKLPIPELIQEKISKEVLVNEAPVTHAGKAIAPILQTKVMLPPKKLEKIKPQDPFKNEFEFDMPKPVSIATPIGGGVEGGTVAQRNLWLPFAVVVAVVLAVFALRPKKRRK